jgi:hypothetical protein
MFRTMSPCSSSLQCMAGEQNVTLLFVNFQVNDKMMGSHQGQPLLIAGGLLASAQAAMIMIYSRGLI